MKKKGLLVLGTIVLVAIVVLCFGIFNNRSKNKDTASSEAENFTTEKLIGYGKDEPQAVRLPNSESLVAIEGITEKDAQMLNQIFRAVEADTTDLDESAKLLLNGFDPEFNLVEAFQAETYDPDGPIAWIANPLQEMFTSASDEAEVAEAIYYNKVGEDYNMSFGYYLMAVCYSRAWKETSPEQVEQAE